MDRERMDELLAALSRVVNSPEFREESRAYLEKYCGEFTMEEENKLMYTTIHSDYEKMVEERLGSALGAEEMEYVCAHLEEYLKQTEALPGAGEEESLVHGASHYDKHFPEHDSAKAQKQMCPVPQWASVGSHPCDGTAPGFRRPGP